MLIDLYMPLDAPLSDDTERFPRLAANAAPAAICCFFDIAGGISILLSRPERGTHLSSSGLLPLQ